MNATETRLVIWQDEVTGVTEFLRLRDVEPMPTYKRLARVYEEQARIHWFSWAAPTAEERAEVEECARNWDFSLDG